MMVKSLTNNSLLISLCAALALLVASSSFAQKEEEERKQKSGLIENFKHLEEQLQGIQANVSEKGKFESNRDENRGSL